MEFVTKQTTKEITAPPRLPDGSNSSNDTENLVPRDVRMPAPALAAPVYPPILEAAMKFLADVRAAGKHRPMQMLLQAYREHGLHPGLITSAEELFKGHPDLLVAFNSFLPGDYQCTVPVYPAAMKFLADVKAAGKYRPLSMLLQDYTEHGLHPGLITRAEELFGGHPDLLVTFNTFLPRDYQCTVRE